MCLPHAAQLLCAVFQSRPGTYQWPGSRARHTRSSRCKPSPEATPSQCRGLLTVRGVGVDPTDHPVPRTSGHCRGALTSPRDRPYPRDQALPPMTTAREYAVGGTIVVRRSPPSSATIRCGIWRRPRMVPATAVDCLRWSGPDQSSVDTPSTAAPRWQLAGPLTRLGADDRGTGMEQPCSEPSIGQAPATARAVTRS